MKSLVSVGAAAAALGALAALSAAGPSVAQAVTNSKAPIDIVGDSLETSNSTCQAVYRGSAEALQDKARLRADVIKIFARQTPAKSGSNSPGCGDMQRIEA